MLNTAQENKCAGGLECYAVGDSTSPGVAVAVADIERTGNGTTTGADLTVWQQYELLSELEEGLDFLSHYVSSDCTGRTNVNIHTPVETRSVEQHSASIDRFPAIETQIATIRSALSLQMKELAEVISVERPTVYSWINGHNTPQPANRERLQALYGLAQQWNRRSKRPLGKSRHLPGAFGRTLFDLLREPAIPTLDVIDRFDALAQSAPHSPTKNETSVRELAHKHGIDLNRVHDAQDDIDLETGKRIDPD